MSRRRIELGKQNLFPSDYNRMERAPPAKNDEIDDCGMKQCKDRARRMGAFGGRTKTTKETSTTQTNIFVENKSKHRTRQRSLIRPKIGNEMSKTESSFDENRRRAGDEEHRLHFSTGENLSRRHSNEEIVYVSIGFVARNGWNAIRVFPAFRRDQRRVTLNDYIVRVTTRPCRSPCLCSRPRRHLPRPPALLLP